MFEKMRILVGVDGSPTAERALIEAINIARCFSASIKVITVYDKGAENSAESILSVAKHSCEQEKIECTATAILGSNPARALEQIAENESFDLIVVGNRGLGSEASILIGSVSRQIISSATCNVLVVKK